MHFSVNYFLNCLRKECFRRGGLNLLYCLCLRKVMLYILIISLCDVSSIFFVCVCFFFFSVSTTDHMFTLIALIQRKKFLNRKMYAAFIDFEKAVDFTNRALLWPILLKNGTKGKL